MRRRVLAAILGVTVLALALFGVPLGVVVQRSADEQATLKLEREAVLTARHVPADLGRGDPVELPTGTRATYGVYDTTGTRLSGGGPLRGDDVVVSALHNRVTQAEVGAGIATAIPIGSDEQVVGALRVFRPTSVSERRVQRITLLLIALGVGVLLVGALVGSLVAGRLVRPVQRLRDDAVRLGAGDFRVQPAMSGVHEVDEASAALAATAWRLDDLVGRERAFSAGASHQLRTPLAAIRTSLETELAFPGGHPERVLADALEDVGRLEATIDELLTYARTSRVEPTRIDVVEVLDRVRDDWNGPLAREGRPLVMTAPADLPLALGVEPLLRQAIDCLMDNAVRHGRGEVRLDARHTTESVTVVISDEGLGFGAQDRATVPVDSGGPHGFGLPLARRLIEASQGRLVVVNAGPNPILDVVLRRAPAQQP